MTINTQAVALGAFRVLYVDGSLQQTCAGARYAGGSRSSGTTLKGDEKVVKIETKATTTKDGSGLTKIVGVKLESDKGTVTKWPWSEYDSLADVQTVAEAAPASGWELKWFCGAETQEYMARLGPIWGKV